MARYASTSRRARAELSCRLGIQYGATNAETLDFFPSTAGAPVVMLIHGGYWRLGSARDISMLARGPLANGIAVAIIDHALCPEVTVDDITEQARTAFAWLWNEAPALGVDRASMFVAGHSAGGQLVGMLLATDWTRCFNLPAAPIKGAIAASGIFDLRGLLRSKLRRELRLTRETARRQSPILSLPICGPPLIVVSGSEESVEFRRQSRAYFGAWRRRGLPGQRIEQRGGDHFTAFESLSRPDGLLTRRLRSLVDGHNAGHRQGD
jgi:arylformamidase